MRTRGSRNRPATGCRRVSRDNEKAPGLMGQGLYYERWLRGRAANVITPVFPAWLWFPVSPRLPLRVCPAGSGKTPRFLTREQIEPGLPCRFASRLGGSTDFDPLQVLSASSGPPLTRANAAWRLREAPSLSSP